MPQPPKSADGQWFWDGSQWRTLLSSDGFSIWNGTAWVPRPPGSVVSNPPEPLTTAPVPSFSGPPPPPSLTPVTPGPPPPPSEPRPAWLPADAPWPPATHTASAPPGPPAPAPPIDWAAMREQQFGPPAYSGLRYAGFWIRFVAIFIDGLIISIPLFIIGLVVGIAIGAGSTDSSAATSTSNTATLPLNGLGIIVQFLYFAYFWSTGSTPGMRLFGLRVVDAQTNSTISFGKAALRFVGYWVSSLLCLVGLIWAAFDSRKQGWHDKIAGTVVVHAR